MKTYASLRRENHKLKDNMEVLVKALQTIAEEGFGNNMPEPLPINNPQAKQVESYYQHRLITANNVIRVKAREALKKYEKLPK